MAIDRRAKMAMVEEYNVETFRAMLKARGIPNTEEMSFTEIADLLARLVVYEIRYERVDDPDALAESIQLKNDAFRKAVFMGPQPDGRVFTTLAVDNLAKKKRALLFQEIINFDNFTEDKDPYGEHVFGCIELDGLPKIYWIINYYEDEMLEERAEDPLNAYRVLVIMFAEEYYHQ